MKRDAKCDVSFSAIQLIQGHKDPVPVCDIHLLFNTHNN